MPKKTRRESQKLRKKKASSADLSDVDNPLANTAINIVDEGESGIDISDIARKEEIARKTVHAPNIVAAEKQNFVQTKEELKAIRNALKGDEIVSEIDEFVVLDPAHARHKKSKQEVSPREDVMNTPLTVNREEPDVADKESYQIRDSLAVNVGSLNRESHIYSRQVTLESLGSLSSRMSHYSSDNSIVEKEGLSTRDTDHPETAGIMDITEDVSYSQASASVIQTTHTVITSSKESESDSDSDDLMAEIIEAKEENTKYEESCISSEYVTVKKRQHISLESADDNDVFLEELQNEILEKKVSHEIRSQEESLNKNEGKGEDCKNKICSWDNIFIKKEIKLKLKKPNVTQSSTSSEEVEDGWKEQLKKIKRKGEVIEEKTLNKYFEEVQTKAFDTEMGYGYVSENEGQPKVKVILKGNSPFLNNELKTRHFQLANLHLYSQVYKVVKANKLKDNGRTFYIFRHFLHLESMTSEEIVSLKIAACSDTAKETIEFIDPLHVDAEFVVVDKYLYNWFLVVSQYPNLPVRVHLVPFKNKFSSLSPIFICPLPRGRHHISRLMQENPGWRKCGYEEPCVLDKGLVYNFFTEISGKKENIGNMKIETWGHDTKWVVYKPEMFKAQDFIESTLALEESNEFVFSGPLSLYDRLRVDVEVPFYQKKLTSWEIATIDQEILADLPPYGKISNLEPFFAYVRAGRLSISQLKGILTHLGYSDVSTTSLPSMEDNKMSTLVQSYLQDWKHKNGSQATLLEFLSVLRMADVALTNIAMEIIQNICNSSCGIAAYSIN